jgi:signal peptide peptidase SppA
MQRSYRYERRGILAIDPQAFLDVFFVEPSSPENTEVGDVTIVDIRGPLEQRSSWRDSYEAIEARVTAACESTCKAIVMRIDSPGGEAAGCFECSRSLRVLCAAADKPLLAYVSGKASSAAYALACAADRIVLSDTGIVGSIGIIASRDDISQMDAMRGLRVAVVASGARKSDGNPHTPVTEAELKEMQTLVDSMAQVFFELVAETRGLDAGDVAALNGKVFHGDAAVSAGLADKIATFDELLAGITAGDEDNMTIKAKAADKSPYESARAALEECAKGDDANAQAAKRALAAMDTEGDKPKGEGDGDKPKDDDGDKDGDKPKGEGDGDKPKDEPKKDEEAADSKAALKALNEVHKLRAEIEQSKVEDERTRLLASRPDFDEAHLKLLRKASLEDVRDAVKNLPVLKGTVKPAATATVPATRGEGQGGPAATSQEGLDMDAAMGLTEYGLGVKRERNSLVFGAVPKPKHKPAAAGATEGAAK